MIKQDIQELIDLGTKLEEIAFKCKVTRPTIQRWLDGDNSPKGYGLQSIKRKIAGMLKAKRREQ